MTAASKEHQDLLQFLYQLPVGVIATNGSGDVSAINPAAVRLLSPSLHPGESVSEPLPVLRRLVPALGPALADSARLGTLLGDREHVIDDDRGSRFYVAAHRISPEQLYFTLSDVSEERRLLEQSHERALRLQRALLGQADTVDVDLSVVYAPAYRGDLAGGDWYDVIAIDDVRFAIAVGDVVGHDIEAAAAMGQLRSIVRANALVDPDPGAVLARTDVLAIGPARFATLNYVLLDRSSNTVRHSSAGHPPPLLIKADGTGDFLTGASGPPLSLRPPLGRKSDETTTMAADDLLVLYTDGLIEQRSEPIDQGLARLRAAACALARRNLAEPFGAALVDDLTRGRQTDDDLCVVALRWRPLSQ